MWNSFLVNLKNVNNFLFLVSHIILDHLVCMAVAIFVTLATQTWLSFFRATGPICVAKIKKHVRCPTISFAPLPQEESKESTELQQIHSDPVPGPRHIYCVSIMFNTSNFSFLKVGNPERTIPGNAAFTETCFRVWDRWSCWWIY